MCHVTVSVCHHVYDSLSYSPTAWQVLTVTFFITYSLHPHHAFLPIKRSTIQTISTTPNYPHHNQLQNYLITYHLPTHARVHIIQHRSNVKIMLKHILSLLCIGFSSYICTVNIRERPETLTMFLCLMIFPKHAKC